MQFIPCWLLGAPLSGVRVGSGFVIVLGSRLGLRIGLGLSATASVSDRVRQPIAVLISAYSAIVGITPSVIVS